jgi:hypothetical protein
VSALNREAIAKGLVAMGFDPGEVEATMAACFGPCLHANYLLGHCPEIARAARPTDCATEEPPDVPRENGCQ